MLAGTDPGLLLEWMEYFQLEPFGEEVADLRNAILCLTVANAGGAKKAGGGRFTLKDFFIPKLGDQEQEFNPDALKRALIRHYGRKNNRKSRRKPHGEDR